MKLLIRDQKMLLVYEVEGIEYLKGLFDVMYEELPAPKIKNKVGEKRINGN